MSFDSSAGQGERRRCLDCLWMWGHWPRGCQAFALLPSLTRPADPSLLF